jgi:hypothetical protein
VKKYYNILGCIQAFTALGAIPAGILFLMDPSGAKMGQTPGMLANSPFTSFLVPGLFLLFVNGFGSATGAVLSFLKHRHAALTGVLLGMILCLWIIIQVYMIGFTSWLQPAFFIVGITEGILGLSLRRR